VIIYSFRLDFPLLAAVPLMKRETDGGVEAEGGDNVRTAVAIMGRPASSSSITVDVRRGTETAREDAARFCFITEAGVRRTCS
jgi:hypothetical protein